MHKHMPSFTPRWRPSAGEPELQRLARSMAQASRPASVARFLADPKAADKIEHTPRRWRAKSGDYAAVFLPGGHGTMCALNNLLGEAWAKGRVSAVCHGPAGLVNVTDVSGKPIVSGRRVAGFTNAEEAAAGLDKDVPLPARSPFARPWRGL